MTAGGATPLSASEFDASLNNLGPFEDNPDIAVAVSGGPDSMALLLLAAAWAARRGGRATGLTVDHGLRRDSATEARTVAAWCADLGIAHRILTWPGPKPTTGVQAAARAARYGLLTIWCRTHHVAHLLLAHHAGDQAETFLYRMSRGSGVDGLAAMPAVSVRDGVRLLRPLLLHRKDRLTAFLGAAGQAFVDDPGNRDPRFARAGLRRRLSALEAAGLGTAPFLAATGALGRLRRDGDGSCAALAATAVAVYPAGYAEIKPAPLAAADADIAHRVLAALLQAVGGRDYAPRRRSLDDLLRALRRHGVVPPRTLGGCVIAPAAGLLRIYREPRAATQRVLLPAEPRLRWDGRFDIVVDVAEIRESGLYSLARLGEQGWQSIAGQIDADTAVMLPGPVRFSLPALWRGGDIVEVPQIGFRRQPSGGVIVRSVQFKPVLPLAGPPFRVA